MNTLPSLDEKLITALPSYVAKNLDLGSEAYTRQETVVANQLALSGLRCIFGSHFAVRRDTQPVLEFLRDKALQAILANNAPGFIGPEAATSNPSSVLHTTAGFAGFGLWVANGDEQIALEYLPHQPLPDKLANYLPDALPKLPDVQAYGRMLPAGAMCQQDYPSYLDD